MRSIDTPTNFSIIASTRGPFLYRPIALTPPTQLVQSLSRMFPSRIHCMIHESCNHSRDEMIGGQVRLICNEGVNHEEFRCNFPSFEGSDDIFGPYEVRPIRSSKTVA